MNTTRSRVNDGLPWEGGVRRSLHEGKEGYALAQSDRRAITTAVLEDIQFMSEWNMCDTLSEGKKQ